MGHRVMEHQKGCPSPQEKRRKASLKKNETGRIDKIPQGNPFILLLSSVVNEQNDNKLVNVLFFRTDELSDSAIFCPSQISINVLFCASYDIVYTDDAGCFL